MFLNDLFEKLDSGKEREVKLKIADLQDRLAKVYNYAQTVDRYRRYDNNGEFKDKVQSVIDGYEKAIARLESELASDETSNLSQIDSLVNKSLRRHCSVALEAIVANKRFLATDAQEDTSAVKVGQTKNIVDPYTLQPTLYVFSKVIEGLGYKATALNSITVRPNVDIAYLGDKSNRSSRRIIIPFDDCDFTQSVTTSLEHLTALEVSLILDIGLMEKVRAYLFKNHYDEMVTLCNQFGVIIYLDQTCDGYTQRKMFNVREIREHAEIINKLAKVVKLPSWVTNAVNSLFVTDQTPKALEANFALRNEKIANAMSGLNRYDFWISGRYYSFNMSQGRPLAQALGLSV